MKAAFYSGANGLRAQQTAMDVIGHNLANSNTQGYQPKSVSFQQLLSKEMYTNQQDSPLVGSGVRAVDAGMQLGKGTPKQTGVPLDFSIIGEGFFAVKNNNQTEYTRNGAFGITMDGKKPYLTTADGGFVLDERGKRISIPRLEDDTYDYQKVQESIGLYTFAQSSALNSVSNNRFAPTVGSGEALRIKGDEKKILRGFLENSGVAMHDEMTNLITAQRAFQISARVIQTADENEQTINNLRK